MQAFLAQLRGLFRRRNLEAEMTEEIEQFNRSEGSYGYVFYVLRREYAFSE